LTVRNYRGGGGGGFRSTFNMGFPPFTRAVKWLVIANSAVYLLVLLFSGIAPRGAAFATQALALIPLAVVHGWVWQLVTYSFLHAGLFHILFNMLTLWMFGAQLETSWGHRQFLEFYFYSVIGAALTTVVVAYLGVTGPFAFLGTNPLIPTVGASGGIYGVMVAFALLYGEQEFMMFPLPFMIKAKYLVAILVLVSLAGAFQGFGAGRGQSVAYFAHLGGALFGYLYIRFLPRRGLLFGASERYFSWRNNYYRWKRRRAARKFEVYMRKHDRKEFFDEYGNYRPPKDEKRRGGDGESRPPWIN
jgi:membrane associated rhomboid family serine protease